MECISSYLCKIDEKKKKKKKKKKKLGLKRLKKKFCPVIEEPYHGVLERKTIYFHDFSVVRISGFISTTIVRIASVLRYGVDVLEK